MLGFYLYICKQIYKFKNILWQRRKTLFIIMVSEETSL